MSNYTLHKLPEGFIVTSDEHWKTKDSLYDFKDNVFRTCKISHFPNGEEVKDRWCKKVIAQQDQIDFSDLKEEEQEEIGWCFDVEKLAEEEYLPYQEGRVDLNTGLKREGFIKGFQKAQELLSDRRFTLEDIKKAIYGTLPDLEGNRRQYISFNQIFECLSQPKSWEVEIEMIKMDKKGKIVDSNIPKFTKGKIKILKLL